MRRLDIAMSRIDSMKHVVKVIQIDILRQIQMNGALDEDGEKKK